jgi:long-subunit acyl-CoA synthetase (AMP-forming)
MSTSIEPLYFSHEGTPPENLALLQLAAERKHDRPSALRRRIAGAWQDTPDWRFHRQVMRIGLYLRERGHFAPRDRIALVATLRPEWAVVAWAGLTLGATVALLDPELRGDELSARIASLAPRAVFAEGATAARIAAMKVPGLACVVALDASGDADGGSDDARPDHVLTWTEALDLGGSLDTAERANAYRAAAKVLSAETPALGYTIAGSESTTWRFVSHRDVVRRVQRVWTRARVARGDTAHVAGRTPSLAAAVELLAFNADGYTQVVFGTGDDLEEIAMMRPHKIVAPPETVRRLLDSAPPAEASRVESWLARVPFVGARFRRAVTTTPTALGRARWMSTGPSLEFAKRARARQFVTLEIDDSLA